MYNHGPLGSFWEVLGHHLEYFRVEVKVLSNGSLPAIIHDCRNSSPFHHMLSACSRFAGVNIESLGATVSYSKAA